MRITNINPNIRTNANPYARQNTRNNNINFGRFDSLESTKQRTEAALKRTCNNEYYRMRYLNALDTCTFAEVYTDQNDDKIKINFDKDVKVGERTLEEFFEEEITKGMTEDLEASYNAEYVADSVEMAMKAITNGGEIQISMNEEGVPEENYAKRRAEEDFYRT